MTERHGGHDVQPTIPTHFRAEVARPMPDPTTILRVDTVTVDLEKTNPPQLTVQAEGQVSSLGWTAPKLSIYVYVVPPADGIQEFDFMATPPSGVVAPSTEKVKASYTIRDMPSWVLGVRVHASSNNVEEKI